MGLDYFSLYSWLACLLSSFRFVSRRTPFAFDIDNGFQVSASKLGCVTGLDLASHCRLLLHDRPRHKLLCRWALLYPLYALSEVAIIATDLAELLGSAIALCMLFPHLELWHAVLITAFDVIFLLALGDPLRGRPVKWFEFLIAALVSLLRFVFRVAYTQPPLGTRSLGVYVCCHRPCSCTMGRRFLGICTLQVHVSIQWLVYW